MRTRRSFFSSRATHGTLAVLIVVSSVLVWPRNGRLNVHWLSQGFAPWDPTPSNVAIEREGDGSFRYLVNGNAQLFIGMGYNPMYRYLSDEERAANYDRDFEILCKAGVNHITGWDADKGYEQDRFDELTLDHANKYGIGVIMPFYLPANGDYTDTHFTQTLLDLASQKIQLFKNHPALRMWGVGNEILIDMDSDERRQAFADFYHTLIHLFNQQDPNHPVIYREAEDAYDLLILDVAGHIAGYDQHPWLLYGMNIYTMRLQELLDRWPSEAPNLPLIISEFGAEPTTEGGRADGYLSMWHMIRDHPSFVLGGAPYTWTTEGPEPTDEKWGLMDGESKPVDSTFEALASEWRKEPGGNTSCR